MFENPCILTGSLAFWLIRFIQMCLFGIIIDDPLSRNLPSKSVTISLENWRYVCRGAAIQPGDEMR